jgi:tetratricopeptide (TPR) repeat protein
MPARPVGDAVRANEGTLALPTYGVRSQNLNPFFGSQYGVAHIYPYTLLDDIDPKPRVRTYRTLQLENRYLRLTVLPDLGGRLYSLYDKISRREVFYKNEVIKFAPLAIRGAFFSGGVEFSFPVAHAPTSADPVNSDLRENADGSATVTCGGLEHISRMRWSVALSLFPGRCALAQDVSLYNPTSIPGRYHYWTNASLPAHDQTEFIYPFRRFRSYEFAGTASWPNARVDLIRQDRGLEGMEGVPKWPADRLRGRVDLRWQRNMVAQVSIFGRQVAWDFFGAWDHSDDRGYAHYADHRNVAGMKLWSWGNAGLGIMNQAALTDDGSLYAETQCGAMETQLDFDFLAPGSCRRWREWWLPLRGLGGLTCASADIGARLSLSIEASGSLHLSLGLCAAQTIRQAAVRVSADDRTLLVDNVDLTPERTWSRTISVAASAVGVRPLTLRVTADSGKILLDYTFDPEPSPVETGAAAQSNETQSAAAFYSLGLKHENLDNREEAAQAYANALSRQPAHGPARLRLGLMRLRADDFAAAQVDLEEAVAAGLEEASFYLGTAWLLQGELDRARPAFSVVPQGHALHPAAVCALGRMALGRGEWRNALECFNEALTESSSFQPAVIWKAVALRRDGGEAEAQAVLESLLETDPLNHLALRERSLCSDAPQPYAKRLERLLADDLQYTLDLACVYLDARLLEDALAILTHAGASWEYPMIGYLAWDICRQLGRSPSESESWLEQAHAAAPEGVFPSRLEEIVTLRRVLEHDMSDAKARYYLGCFLYAHEQFEEAIGLWEQALPALQGFAVLHRNLGLAYWHRRGDLPAATRELERAMDIAPSDQELYLHLDFLYKAQGLVDARATLFERMRLLTAPRDDVHKRMVIMLVDLNRHREAVRMLEDTFVPSEMDQSFRNAFVTAHLGVARGHEQAGRLEEAIAIYKRALTYPANVGTGRPLTTCDA